MITGNLNEINDLLSCKQTRHSSNNTAEVVSTWQKKQYPFICLEQCSPKCGPKEENCSIPLIDQNIIYNMSTISCKHYSIQSVNCSGIVTIAAEPLLLLFCVTKTKQLVSPCI